MIRIYCLRKESISNQRENTYEESNDRGVPSTDGYIYNTISKHYTQGTLLEGFQETKDQDVCWEIWIVGKPHPWNLKNITT